MPVIEGCTDSEAPNYNEFANTDDGYVLLLLRVVQFRHQ